MVDVFLVDDHELVRRGLIDLVSADPEIEVIRQAASVSEATARIPALRPDVAVIDVRLPDGNGTVKNYVSRLLTKLGMERRTQAAVFISTLDQSRHRSDDCLPVR